MSKTLRHTVRAPLDSKSRSQRSSGARALFFVGAALPLLCGQLAAVETGDLVGITAAHNEVRQNLNDGEPPVAGEPVQPVPVPPLLDLVWSDEVAADAQFWAEGCVYEHSSSELGENLAAYAGSPGTPESVVADWAGEASDYFYEIDTCAFDSDCGHYTQVVWSTSLAIGCGYADCSVNSPFGEKFPDWRFWVCNYDPAGNYPVRPYCTETQTDDCELGPLPTLLVDGFDDGNACFWSSFSGGDLCPFPTNPNSESSR